MTLNITPFVNLILLSIVLFGVEHYTGHWCIAISVVAALLYLK